MEIDHKVVLIRNKNSQNRKICDDCKEREKKLANFGNLCVIAMKSMDSLVKNLIKHSDASSNR